MLQWLLLMAVLFHHNEMPKGSVTQKEEKSVFQILFLFNSFWVVTQAKSVEGRRQAYIPQPRRITDIE